MKSGFQKSKLKYHLRVRNGKEINNEIEYSLTSIDVYGSGGIFKYTDTYLTKGPSVLFGRKGTIGKPLFVENYFWTVDTMYYTEFIKDNFPKYFFYLLIVFPWDKFATKTALPSVVGSDIENENMLVPTSKLQCIIADFLDAKCKEIDLLITQKLQQIELLKHQRQSIITEAVTKGLNPNVKMKDSGVEWIGEIPEHWEISKIKYKFSIKKLIKPKENPIVLSLTQKGLKIKDLNDFSGQHADSYDKYQEVKIKDYVMNGMDLLTGYVDCSKFEGVTSPDYRVFRIKNDEESHDYFLRYFQICYFSRIFYGHGQGVSNFGRWRLQTEVFKDFPIPVPSIEEQYEISNFLKDKESYINNSISTINLQIEKLKEYRQSLIYEAVTGKIDVTEMELEEVR